MREAFRVLSEVSNFAAVYFVTLLARCAIVSLPVLGVILLLRATVFRSMVLWKGAVWLFILIVPFFGRLRAYYEVFPFGLPFLYCQNLPADFPLLRWGYLTVAFCLLVRIVIRQRRTKKLLWYTTRTAIAGEEVYLTDAPVSPFAVGLFRPKIILPEAMTRALSESELETVVLHEKTHIRLLHLWIFFLWDILAAAYWINPLLFIASGKLREDMEQVCDYVTMERGQKDAGEYGGLLLKSMGLLRDESFRAEVMLFGEGGYRETKRRFERIADFRFYQRRVAVGFLVVLLFTVAACILFIHAHSWSNHTVLPDIMVTDERGRVYVDGKEAEQSGAISREGDDLVVDAEKLRAFLPDGFSEQEYVYFYYDTVMKLPGMGGCGRCAWVERLPEAGRIKATVGEVPWWDLAISWVIERM